MDEFPDSTGRRYDSVEDMMRGEGIGGNVFHAMLDLLARDKGEHNLFTDSIVDLQAFQFYTEDGDSQDR